MSGAAPGSASGRTHAGSASGPTHAGVLPLVVNLAGHRVVVVGAGTVAARKIETLLEAQADVVAVAPGVDERVRTLADAGALTLHERPYLPGDLDGAVLAVAATDAADVNDRVAADAAGAGLLCVRADGGGTASFAAAVRRGPFVVAVSTGGTAPALARQVREELERTYGPEHGDLAELLGELRESAAAASLTPAQRRAAWRRILATDILTLLRTGQRKTAKEVATACLSSSSD